MQTYEPMCGESISHCAEEMVKIAASTGFPVRATFNDTEVLAMPNQSAEAIEGAWHAEMDRKAKEYRESPEGKRAAIEAAKRQEEYERDMARSLAEGLLPFTLKDAEAEAGWQKTVDANQDGYGSAVMRYAARWANLMEAKMGEGKHLEDVANDASHEADLEGITGFMYGCAVSILAQTWIHGEQLRRWHNYRHQLGTEGERANHEGGVLNPALLNIRKQ